LARSSARANTGLAPLNQLILELLVAKGGIEPPTHRTILVQSNHQYNHRNPTERFFARIEYFRRTGTR